MRFKYNDKVEIVTGLFRGCKGRIKEVRETTNKEGITITEYKVEYTKDKNSSPVNEWIPEHNLKMPWF